MEDLRCAGFIKRDQNIFLQPSCWLYINDRAVVSTVAVIVMVKLNETRFRKVFSSS